MMSGHFTFPVVLVVFAALLLFAAPSAATEDAAGSGVYNNVSEEADFLRKRAAELDAKTRGFMMQVENDEAESARLEAQARRLKAQAEQVDGRAKQAESGGDGKEAARLEKAAEKLEDKADRLGDQADDLQDSAEAAEDMAKTAENQAARVRELADALDDIAGRWQCVVNSGAERWLEETEDNESGIDVEPSERHGFGQEVYDLLPNYDYAEQARIVAEYEFTREKELGQSYEFKTSAARLFSGEYGGKWKMTRRDDGEIFLFFERINGLVKTGELEFSGQSVEIDNFFGNDPAPNWRGAPALVAEMQRMEGEVVQIFIPARLQGTFDFPESPTLFRREFSWWEKHCERVEQ